MRHFAKKITKYERKVWHFFTKVFVRWKSLVEPIKLKIFVATQRNPRESLWMLRITKKLSLKVFNYCKILKIHEQKYYKIQELLTDRQSKVKIED